MNLGYAKHERTKTNTLNDTVDCDSASDGNVESGGISHLIFLVSIDPIFGIFEKYSYRNWG